MQESESLQVQNIGSRSRHRLENDSSRTARQGGTQICSEAHAHKDTHGQRCVTFLTCLNTFVRHTPGATGVFECKLVWLMCVAHISGRYCSPVGSSRGWVVIKDTPSVSVQLVGGVLTFEMQRSLTVHPACLHSNAFCVCLLSLLMLRWLTFLRAENFLMEGKMIPGLVSA